MKNILTAILLSLLGVATPVLASSESGAASPMVKLFLGFFAMVIVCQLIPGMGLFASMLKGLFGRAAEKRSLVEK